MLKLICSPRLFLVSSYMRMNSTAANKVHFDILQVATQSAGENTKLNTSSYLDSQASKKPYNLRRTDIISDRTFEEDPKVLLRSLPRTGSGMGTSVEVRNGNVKSAIGQLTRLLRTEQVMQTRQAQRFHMKPSKVKGAEKTRKRKEWFRAGLKQLFKSVKDARRRGY